MEAWRQKSGNVRVCALEVLRQRADTVGVFGTWMFGIFGACFGGGTQRKMLEIKLSEALLTATGMISS